MNHHIDSTELPCPCFVVDAQIGLNNLWIIARIQADQSKRDATIREVSTQFGTDAARGTGDQYGVVQKAAGSFVSTVIMLNLAYVDRDEPRAVVV